MILLDPSARLVIAHRGDRMHAPENTIAAFERGLAAGAQGLELDVRLTADGHVVVCHDPLVDRTTDGRGAVQALSLDAIRKLDAGARWSPHSDPEMANGGAPSGEHPFAGQGIRLPLLAEVLDTFRETPCVVEMKTPEVSGPATKLILAAGANSRVLVGAFDRRALVVPREAKLPTVASRGELARLLIPALIGIRPATPRRFQAVAISPTYRGLPLPIAGYVRTTGVPVHVWTVNDPSQGSAFWAAGVCGVMTDDPGPMVAALRASGLGNRA